METLIGDVTSTVVLPYVNSYLLTFNFRILYIYSIDISINDYLLHLLKFQRMHINRCFKIIMSSWRFYGVFNTIIVIISSYKICIRIICKF